MSARPPAQEIIDTTRWCVERDAPAMLIAATAEWIETEDFLRLTYFLEGIYEEADYETIDIGITEITSHFWGFINIGAAFVFDDLLLANAKNSPHLVYLRK